MTQVVLRAESEFAAGVACHPCRINGAHFCQAHDYGENDRPTCKTCLTGYSCGPMKARERRIELDGPELPPAQPRFEDKSATCPYGCGKRRHRGVCAARRAMERVSIAAVILPTPQPAVVPEEHRAAVRTLDEPETLHNAICVKPEAESFTQPPAGPTFEIVPRDQVPWRGWQRRDRYAALLVKLPTVPRGSSLKMRFPSQLACEKYVKHLSRALKRAGLSVIHERHGNSIFFDVQPLPTNEVPAL